MSASTETLATFRGDEELPERSFSNSPDQVCQAYIDAATRAAGMSVIDRSVDALLIDSRPTVRVMDGSFGLVLRVDFAANGAEISVRVAACSKVEFAFVWNLHAAVREAERVLRRHAKAIGITEVIQ